MISNDWYQLVPEDEHSSNHRYCDPAKCPALLRRRSEMDEPSELFHVRFTTADVDEDMAEEAGVSLDEAVDRAEHASRAIRDHLIETGNSLLRDAVAGTL